MPRHKPIQFKSTLEPNTASVLKSLVRESKIARNTLNAVLVMAGLGGILTIGVMATGVYSAFGKIKKASRKESYEEYRNLWANYRKLKQRGAIELVQENEDGTLIYQITEKGQTMIKKVIYDEMEIKKPKFWDKNWRLVIFDIPEKLKVKREALRDKINSLGFYQCQKSVWIHPLPCNEEVDLISEMLNIKPYIKIFLVDEMTDGKVLYHFKELLKKIIINK